MTRQKTTFLSAALLSLTLMSSPLALAGQGGDHPHRGDHGKGQYGGHHHAEMCARMNDSDWAEKRDAYRQQHDSRHEAMAERLQLDDSQRKIWDEMREERQRERQQRVNKLREHCENRDSE